LPSKPWPNGATTVGELAALGKPVECVNTWTVQMESANGGTTELRETYQIKGEKARKFLRVEGFPEEQPGQTEYYDGASRTYPNGVSNGAPTAGCTWEKATDEGTPTLAERLSDTVTPGSFNCVLASFYDAAVTAPKVGEKCA
jgi:hypothetical protein